MGCPMRTQNLTQTQVAAAMETSQSFVARLESTAGDAKISTVDRYAESLGYVVNTTSSQQRAAATPRP